MLSFVNQQFLLNQQFVWEKFDIRNTIVHIVEVVLVKKSHLLQNLEVIFEHSFPQGQVMGDYVHFHSLFMHLLELIFIEDQEKRKNSSEQKREVRIDCKLKEISKNDGNYVLLFDFIFKCEENQEIILQKAIRKSKNIKYFIEPKKFLKKKYGEILVDFFIVQKLEGNIDFFSYQDTQDKKIISIELNFKTIQMLNLTPSNTTQKLNYLDSSNRIQNQILLNLTFLRENLNNKNIFQWKFQEENKCTKKQYKNTLKQSSIIPQPKNINKQKIIEQSSQKIRKKNSIHLSSQQSLKGEQILQELKNYNSIQSEIIQLNNQQNHKKTKSEKLIIYNQQNYQKKENKTQENIKSISCSRQKIKTSQKEILLNKNQKKKQLDCIIKIFGQQNIKNIVSESINNLKKSFLQESQIILKQILKQSVIFKDQQVKKKSNKKHNFNID
ncbi:hypothetical protein IMG5_164570 [Ichthyophthirius multifiliis]|uniref:Uncharacterized protein n=1 Tax=Ichthyophthirius multifiliis TaxID=5932 RepID=G0R0G5_ICHMU|nr:hypothetical protein IMG5_164570 [Ichthyophthirius multifiliis]EGR29044.1 hypothetical protein IMG5_164570 [Ichthyophthirius multifiliis]|eukprot:XP_004030280.1 hypothetical protein IMG5_164570 [Ichthyophthirius multifiliis]